VSHTRNESARDDDGASGRARESESEREGERMSAGVASGRGGKGGGGDEEIVIDTFLCPATF